MTDRCLANRQNEALYQICVTELKQKTPEYKDLNRLIAKVMAGFTSKLHLLSRVCNS